MDRIRLARALGALAAFASSFALAGPASAVGVMRITEWMYNGDEFIEFTNVGDTAVDMAGWSFDDDSQDPGIVSLADFGTVDPGESVILAEVAAADFRAAWNLAASVSVIGNNTVNLGRADEINLFDGTTLVDTLTYNDQTIGGPRTQNISANILLGNLGLNRADLAVASFAGDAFGSVLSTSSFPGNPGAYAPVPEPGAFALVALGLLGLGLRRRSARAAAAGAALALAAPHAASALTLSSYTVTGTFALPAAAPEASAVTYNWDSGTLFVLGDEGDALVEVLPDGTQVSTMALTGFDDTEGLTYVGGGRFVLTEERLRDAFLVTYAAGGSVARASLPTADLGTTVGNIGIEGISFDRRDGRYLLVKETGPQEVNVATISFSPGSASVSPLFAPGGLGVSDLSDVSVLSGVDALVGTPGADDLLIYSQESRRLLHVTRAGLVLGSLDFSAYSLEAEGVTIDPNGTIFIVAESRLPSGGQTLFVLTPEPGTFALVAAGLAALGLRRRA